MLKIENGCVTINGETDKVLDELIGLNILAANRLALDAGVLPRRVLNSIAIDLARRADKLESKRKSAVPDSNRETAHL